MQNITQFFAHATNVVEHIPFDFHKILEVCMRIASALEKNINQILQNIMKMLQNSLLHILY